MRVLFCGQSSYPSTNSATANRYRAIADVMAGAGCEAVFVNRHGVFKVPSDVDGAKYMSVSPSGVVRHRSFFFRNLKKLIALPKEMKAIVGLDRERKVDYINIYTQYFFDLLFYRFVAVIIRAKCIVHVVELRSSIQNRSALLRLNDWMFERFSPVLFSKFIAISRKTADIVSQPDESNDVLIVPPLCDFSAIQAIEKRPIRSDVYFLYCASLEYEEVAWFVIQSYLNASLEGVSLVMVLSGELSERIRQASAMAANNITIYSGISYADLFSLYKGALALLIPMRECVQDAARFPQKISEYLASGRPIVTTKNGEIPYYFTHDVNAIVASCYEVADYSKCMEYALELGERLEVIAENGLELGLEKFEVNAYFEHAKIFLGVEK